jgi:glycerol-3-phosphate dehydrogenase
MLDEASPADRATIGSSRFVRAEIPWIMRTECPATLCDLLERRMRLALFGDGQGVPELAEIAARAGEAAGWDAARVRSEATAYAAAVRRRYQIVLPRVTGLRESARVAAA